MSQKDPEPRRPELLRCSRCRKVTSHEPTTKDVESGGGGVSVSVPLDAWKCSKCGRVRF